MTGRGLGNGSNFSDLFLSNFLEIWSPHMELKVFYFVLKGLIETKSLTQDAEVRK